MASEKAKAITQEIVLHQLNNDDLSLEDILYISSTLEKFAQKKIQEEEKHNRLKKTKEGYTRGKRAMANKLL